MKLKIRQCPSCHEAEEQFPGSATTHFFNFLHGSYDIFTRRIVSFEC